MSMLGGMFSGLSNLFQANSMSQTPNQQPPANPGGTQTMPAPNPAATSNPGAGLSGMFGGLNKDGGWLDKFVSTMSPEYAMNKVLAQKLGLPAPSPLGTLLRNTSFTAQSGGKSVAMTGGGDQGGGDSMMKAALLSKFFGDEKQGVEPTGYAGGPTNKNAEEMARANSHADTVIKDAMEPIRMNQKGDIEWSPMGRNPFQEFMNSVR